LYNYFFYLSIWLLVGLTNVIFVGQVDNFVALQYLYASN